MSGILDGFPSRQASQNANPYGQRNGLEHTKPAPQFQSVFQAATGVAGRSEMLYGGRGTPDLVLLADMRAMGVALHLTTEDGSTGRRGLVTAALEERLAHHDGPPIRIMGCGPNAMLWAVGRIARDRGIPCFISLEEQMACGIGVCLGCAIPARSRPFRYVCSNGPVFDASDVLDVGGGPPAAACLPSVPAS
jgi:dihydroorotate dehydrogenase electron transfer subunit